MSDLPLWTPSPSRIDAAAATRFAAAVTQRSGVSLPDFHALWRWSVAEPIAFWQELWVFADVLGEQGAHPHIADAHKMPGARFFPQGTLNFARNLVERGNDHDDALVFRGEDKIQRRMTRGELRHHTARFAQALQAAGVGKGDRVAAYIPNMPEGIIAMLGTAALGAIWSSCSPDFGPQGVVDRFGQIEPSVLVTVDGYWYNGKAIAIGDKVREIASRLPSVKQVVVVSYLVDDTALDGVANAIKWDDFLAPHQGGDVPYVDMPFNAPLYILYSSGTTGVPKCIVHGAGGTLLQHLKEHLLHGDLRASDRLFYFTTCGWMMWNWLVSGLAVGATLLLYDGSPFVLRGRILWDYAEEEGMTHFGTSAKYIDALKKVGLVPRKDYKLSALRVMLSTGSPLAPESFDYVYQCIKDDLCLSSISGGTDIVSCFALGSPTLPVYRGEIQTRGLGLAVDVYDDNGESIPAGAGRRGELVCTQPFPCMPLGFWADDDGARYHAAYFERFANVWCHGDYVELTAHDGLVIYGRSDATLNPGGVRIGTAEIYRQVEQLDEVMESLVIGQEWPPEEGADVRVVLFVKLRDGLELDNDLSERIKATIRASTTPRHAPAKIVQVTDIPRTKSNKIVELAVRNVVHGRPVRNLEALANPEALEQYRDRPELST